MIKFVEPNSVRMLSVNNGIKKEINRRVWYRADTPEITPFQRECTIAINTGNPVYIWADE